MFSVVNFETNDGDGPRISRSTQAYVSAHQRSACDLCRAQKIECHGYEDVCTPCAKSSRHCTYTLSSRTGAGRKRLRNNPWRHSRAPVTQSKTSDTCCPELADEPKLLPCKTSKTTHNTAVTQPQDSPTLTAPSVDLDIQNFWDMMPNADTWLDTQATWSPGSLCAHIVRTTTPHDITTATFAETPGITGQHISTDHSIALPPASQPAPLSPTSCSSNRVNKEHLAPPNHESRQGNDGDDDDCSSFTSQPGKSPSTAQNSPTQNPCMCACEVQKILYMPGLRFEIGQAMPTDDALLCLQTGIQQCRHTLACAKCDVNADKQILMTTVVGRLVELAVEILDHSARSELSTASTPATTATTTLFRFGRYVLQNSRIQASLLRSLMAIHIKEMEDMLRQLRSRVSDQQSPLTVAILAESERRTGAISQMLSGALSPSDGGLGDDVFGCLELSKHVGPMLWGGGIRG